jgi:hypothetical protein
MVVDIINKTLDTTAIVKYWYWHQLQNHPILILMVTLKKLDQYYFLGRSIRHKNLFTWIEQKFKDSKFNKQLLMGKTKHFLPLMNPPSSWWIISIRMDFFLDSFSFMNKIINKSTTNGILGLFFFFCWVYSSHHELAYNYNILLFNPYWCCFIFGIQTRRNGSTTALCSTCFA